MQNNRRRFYSLNDYFKEHFNEKIFKISLDGNFTCPNRDGKVGEGGCTFCSDSGSGEFTADFKKSINSQVEEQLNFLSSKVKDSKVIAYFQNFTNTYADIDYLKSLYLEALSHPRVMGIAIATRPDCLGEDVLELLNELNKKYFLWVELGLQTSNDLTAKNINRGYDFEVYKKACEDLNALNIKFVTHMIVGLPHETKEDILKTSEDIIESKPWGIKIHSLHILKNTKIAKEYFDTLFHIFSLEEYVDIVVTILKNLPKNIVVHRITGDGKKEEVIEPIWSLNKRAVLNEIEKELKRRDLK